MTELLQALKTKNYSDIIRIIVSGIALTKEELDECYVFLRNNDFSIEELTSECRVTCQGIFTKKVLKKFHDIRNGIWKPGAPGEFYKSFIEDGQTIFTDEAVHHSLEIIKGIIKSEKMVGFNVIN